MVHTLPDLPYSYDALEPYICAEIMELHHGTHHKAYVTNLNAAQAKMKEAVAGNDVKKAIELQSAIKFNGGGEPCTSCFTEKTTAIPTLAAVGPLQQDAKTESRSQLRYMQV